MSAYWYQHNKVLKDSKSFKHKLKINFMARMIGPFTVIGRLGNVSVYKRKGSDEVFVRMKGGPSAETIKKSPSMQNLREHNIEFGGCGRSGGLIKDATDPVSYLRDFNIVSEFNSYCTSLLPFDTTSLHGERAISFSKGRSLLEGFNFNRPVTLDSVLRTPIYCTVSRDTCSASIDLPEVVPEINFYPPANNALYRFLLSFCIINDMIYEKGMGYIPLVEAGSQTSFFPKQIYTDWQKIDNTMAARRIDMNIPDVSIGETTSILLAVGIELRTSKQGDSTAVRKNGGFGKILAFR